MDDDEKYWRDEVKKSTRGELETVRKAAAGWAALFAAVLGIFGTVTFAGGLEGLEKLDEKFRFYLVTATLVAAVSSLVATILSGIAAGPSARRSDSEAWQDFENDTRNKASRAFLQLRLAKIAGIIAATVVVAGSAFILIVGPADEEQKDPLVLAVINGRAVCGPLVRDESSISIQGVQLSSKDVSQIQVVSKCP